MFGAGSWMLKVGRSSDVHSVPAKEKILVAMSGGVDSSVAALLLQQQGHEIVGRLHEELDQ